jgi:diaminopimelate decarboxylase
LLKCAPPDVASRIYDIVGPICECGDFLAKNREIPPPGPEIGAGIAVWDVGAYCSSMGSNYNMRPKLAEVLVDGSSWQVTRRAETFKDILATYDELGSPATETAL